MTLRRERWQPWVARATDAAKRLQQVVNRPVVRRWALMAALAVFLVGIPLSIRELPTELGLVAPRELLLIALVGVPAAIVANAADTKLAASLVGTRFGWYQSMYVGLVSSAANMLPLPGGALVRVTALKGSGASLLKSGVSTTLLAGLWLGLALSLGGTWIAVTHPWVAVPLLGVGVLALLGFCVALHTICRSWRLLALAVIVKLTSIAIGVIRMAWALAALGVIIPLGDLAVFAVADVAGAAVMVLPAGLGVNESVAALLAPLVAVPSAAAFLAVGLNRVVALPTLLVVTAAVAALGRERREAARLG